MKAEVLPLTFQGLRQAIEELTPEQLEMPVFCTKENGGGAVYGLEVLTEDQIDPDGEGMAPISVYRDSGLTEAEIAEEPIAARKGQPLLVMD